MERKKYQRNSEADTNTDIIISGSFPKFRYRRYMHDAYVKSKTKSKPG